MLMNGCALNKKWLFFALYLLDHGWHKYQLRIPIWIWPLNSKNSIKMSQEKSIVCSHAFHKQSRYGCSLWRWNDAIDKYKLILDIHSKHKFLFQGVSHFIIFIALLCMCCVCGVGQRNNIHVPQTHSATRWHCK